MYFYKKMKLFLSIAVVVFNPLFSYCQDLMGDWKGNIKVNNSQIPIVFHFYKDSAKQIEGKWESPSQNAKNLPCGEIDVNGDSIMIGLQIISGHYSGKFITADSIAGTWYQGNGQSILNLKKFVDTSTTILYPGEKEVSVFSAANGKLYGTLLSKSIHQKLVIIIAGSGPTDRDGNNPMGDEANSYEMLSHALDSQNIATFRFDKRGVAQSIPAGFKEENLLFDDYIKDAEKIFDYIHDTLGFKDIYFAGHSEGSLTGIMASQQEKVKGFISIAGAGRPLDVVINEQLNNQSFPDSLKEKITFIFNELKEGRKVDDVPVVLNALFRKSVQPYIISWLRYDPVTEIKKLDCPVLILQGSCDAQVKIKDAENLHNANKKSKLDIIPLMTHTLKNAGEGCNDENHKTYTDPSLPLNRQLVNDIVNFVGN